jgi:hypothetical protein
VPDDPEKPFVTSDPVAPPLTTWGRPEEMRQIAAVMAQVLEAPERPGPCGARGATAELSTRFPLYPELV